MKHFFSLSVLLLMSCKTSTVGKWSFADAKEGKVSDVKYCKQNLESTHGKGILEFKDDGSFLSINDKNSDLGTYEIVKDTIKMSYNKTNPKYLEISYLRNKCLMLSSIGNSTYTWIYIKK